MKTKNKTHMWSQCCPKSKISKKWIMDKYNRKCNRSKSPGPTVTEPMVQHHQIKNDDNKMSSYIRFNDRNNRMLQLRNNNKICTIAEIQRASVIWFLILQIHFQWRSGPIGTFTNSKLGRNWFSYMNSREKIICLLSVTTGY